MCACRTEESKCQNQWVVWFDEVSIADIPMVGGKNASLGEMIRELSREGVSVPYGFCTTAEAYRYYIRVNKLEEKLRAIFKDLDVNDVANLAKRGKQARNIIMRSPLPQDLEEVIVEKYNELCEKNGDVGDKNLSETCDYDLDVAVRSSATAEDLPDASFAGQQETYLNVRGSHQVVRCVLKCFASLFTDRAISYRTLKGFDHFVVALSCGIQKMVRSDLASAGVIFTINTENGFNNVVLVTGSYGLGEMVVQGTVNPDEFTVFKPTLRTNFKPIIGKSLGSKDIKMIYSVGGNKLTRTVDVPATERAHFCINDEEILQLARWACIIEEHYTNVHGKYTPMDIEWAKCGKTGKLYVVQARPETVQSRKMSNVLKCYKLVEKGPVLTKGKSVGEMIGASQASVIKNVHEIGRFREGDVLVTNRTDPDWEPIMKKAAAIVTNQGGRTCHAAIIARELGIPAVVGCCDATEKISSGDEVTVCCAEGDDGIVYSGILSFRIDETSLQSLPQTKTQIMMNVGNPCEAMALSFIPNSGVGLARLEFIIANHIRTHPLALLHFDELESKDDKEQITKLTRGYKNKAQYFVDSLASGIAMIAAAFFPHAVIVRLSDFKTNEYANLLGGFQFEPKEENPMIGWRGASRYYDPKYSEAFALECQALLKVREEMGLTNVIPMIPFCRTPEEGRKVISVMADNGLRRGENGLQVYVMCEVPSNVILAREFAQIFDGFSIGSNDLTQLTLGLDRDSGLVAHIFDERNEAVKTMIRTVIQTCKETKTKIGICGQAPSDYPEFAAFLVECGIDSISLNPDSVLKTILQIASLEERLAG